jgi:hypothetical protein
MYSTLLILLASCSAASSNLFFRLNISQNISSKAYLATYYLLSLVVALVLNPEIFNQPFNLPMTLAGALVGSLSVTLMWLTSKALSKGPSGLTFAFQNSSAIFPPLILFLLFGPEFDYKVSPLQMVGMAIVVLGLFLAATKKNSTSQTIPSTWYKYGIGCFVVQALALTLIQWRCLLIDPTHSHFLIPTNCNPSDDVWFLPGMFCTASLLQLITLTRDAKLPKLSEIGYGILGGITNGGSAFFLALATKWAFSVEKVILFPLFAVTVIFLSHLWSRYLYKEKIDLISNGLCALGIFTTALA